MSRSDNMPITRPSPPATITAPMRRSLKILTAARSDAVGSMVTTEWPLFAKIALTVMDLFSVRGGRPGQEKRRIALPNQTHCVVLLARRLPDGCRLGRPGRIIGPCGERRKRLVGWWEWKFLRSSRQAASAVVMRLRAPPDQRPQTTAGRRESRRYAPARRHPARRCRVTATRARTRD